MLPGSGGFALLERVLDVGRGHSWPLWNLMPFFIVQTIAFELTTRALGERRLDVQLRVPLEQRVVHQLVRLVVRRQDAAERRDVGGVRLEPPDDPCRPSWSASPAARLVAAPPCRASAPAATAPAPTAPAFFSRSRRLSSRLVAGFRTFVSSDIVLPSPIPEVVRGSDRPSGLRPGCRRRRRTHGLESGESLRRPPGRARRRARVDRDTSTSRPSSRRLHQDVELLQRVVRVARKREVRRRGGEMRVAPSSRRRARPSCRSRTTCPPRRRARRSGARAVSPPASDG